MKGKTRGGNNRERRTKWRMATETSEGERENERQKGRNEGRERCREEDDEWQRKEDVTKGDR